jgi:hypothetical protein
MRNFGLNNGQQQFKRVKIHSRPCIQQSHICEHTKSGSVLIGDEQCLFRLQCSPLFVVDTFHIDGRLQFVNTA